MDQLRHPRRARRQLVESLFAPIKEDTLNADEQIELVAARSNGIRALHRRGRAFCPAARLDPASAAAQLVANFSRARRPRSSVTTSAVPCQGGDGQGRRLRRLSRAAVTLLQSPEYQLC